MKSLTRGGTLLLLLGLGWLWTPAPARAVCTEDTPGVLHCTGADVPVNRTGPENVTVDSFIEDVTVGSGGAISLHRSGSDGGAAGEIYWTCEPAGGCAISNPDNDERTCEPLEDEDGNALGTCVQNEVPAGPSGQSGPDATLTVDSGNFIITSPTEDAAFGIIGRSNGGNGRGGSNAYVFGSAGNGQAGTDGGRVEVTVSGNVVTNGANAVGIAAVSQAGNGGNGGNAYVVGGSAGSGGAGGFGGLAQVTFNAGSVVTVGEKAIGVSAVSQGGNGGAGGGGGGLVFSPGGGNSAGQGGAANVLTGAGTSISTEGDYAHGILAQSLGGPGGGGTTATGVFYTGGGSGGTGGNGGLVTVSNGSTIVTRGDNAQGLLAQSIGGGGGDAGRVGGLVALGATGGAGGAGGEVKVTNSGAITTYGASANAIEAQSIGGGGGNGQRATGLYSMGGDGAGTTTGGVVTVTNTGTLKTHGQLSSGILVQSIGGGGGNGGSGSGLFTSGGSGGAGNDGDDVLVINGGNIETGIGTNGQLASGVVGAYGIFAQSVGGGGGNGGGAISGGVGFSAAFGGTGGAGGLGQTVRIMRDHENVAQATAYSIITHGDESAGVFAQSVGGGGGNGGFAGSFTVGDSASIALGVAGAGGPGGVGGQVIVGTKGSITTYGTNSTGIFAQSVGGGGGHGGLAVTAAVSVGAAVSIGVGGAGGAGGDGDNVTVGSYSNIFTSGTGAAGIKAQSIGGGGGDGGMAASAAVGGVAGVAIGVGGTGGDGGVGKTVTVGQTGTIWTQGKDANGIVAQSIGGGGGDGGASFSAGLSFGGAANVSVGGSGGAGQNAGIVGVTVRDGGGRIVDATYGSFNIVTGGDNSNGILAQSLGGGGGNGGLAGGLALGQGASLSTSVAGGGDGGGDALKVTVRNGEGSETGLGILTHGQNAAGIKAQSIGGGGGNGGMAVSISGGGLASLGISVGGSGGAGGLGGEVVVGNFGNITTLGNFSSAIMAQSIGGGGGNGGNAISASLSGPTSLGSAALAIGGNGAIGASANMVEVTSTGNISTSGAQSYGILAQSLGGGGGNGGFALSGSFSMGVAAGSLALGGDGGDGSTAQTVTVVNTGSITTRGDGAAGILAQSVGGSGGNGGFSIAGSVAITGSLSVAVGGSGGTGGEAEQVTVTSVGNITTGIAGGLGVNADGIKAQSIGGGGGNGGFSGGLSFGGTVALGISIAGPGGFGGEAKGVTVGSTGNIATYFNSSNGILAQSIGGGGGNGGFAFTVSGSQQASAAVSVGGAGGTGNTASTVIVDQVGTIQTSGRDSNGILAQSIGGSGGNGGFSVAAGLSMGALGASVAVGGGGGTGAEAGTVTVRSSYGGTAEAPLAPTGTAASIWTKGENAAGILAQSIGGGGGNGGFAAGLSTAATGAALGVSVGGDGGFSGTAKLVTVIAYHNVLTQGDNAYGIAAQSIGGGGGNGGASIALAGAMEGVSGSFAIGGKGGAGNFAGQVDVTSVGLITTEGDNAHGILAQSLGGGGGNGGMAFSGAATLSTGFSLAIAVGGSAGMGSYSDKVTVNSTGAITTKGSGAVGILAQSLGGGGGNGGWSAAAGLSANFGVSVGVGGSGAGGGAGGEVHVTSVGNISTGVGSSNPDAGANADGIKAQSIGGGGGNGGFAGGLSAGADIALGVSVGGNGDLGGEGKTVTVNSTGDISTVFNASNGILAQSIGGGGGNGGFAVNVAASSNGPGGALGIGGGGKGGGKAGLVTVVSVGSIATQGDSSNGILAQSLGGGGGNGGFALTGGFTLRGVGASIGVGGSGSGGGGAEKVTVRASYAGTEAAPAAPSGLAPSIYTQGANAAGILAQSIGGGGGNGGFVAAVGAGTSGAGGSISVGGKGSTGAHAGEVEVVSYHNVLTLGYQSYGVAAQSLGGGGGNGGLAIALSGAGSGLAGSIAIGGSGDGGGKGNIVKLTSVGNIATGGQQAHGILAQSIGGGGGNGGAAFSLAGSLDTGAGTISVGGSGKKGGTAEAVTVNSTGSIATVGDGAVGILAQSLGGGGGNGGWSVGGALGSKGGIAITVGGSAGEGNEAGAVTVTSTGNILTGLNQTNPDLGANADGIKAQSIGGGGGNGGFAGGLALGADGALGITVGGGGALGAAGKAVTVTSTGDISTVYNNSNGILAQSIGGGGGNGGGALSVAATSSGANGSIAVGGSGQGGGTASTVTVTSIGAISTRGDNSNGILAQSLGGGGGNGGFALSGALSLKGVGIGLTIGGSAGGGNRSEKVTVHAYAAGTEVAPAAPAANVISLFTAGDESAGILAQSIGGGGGNGGFAGVLGGATSGSGFGVTIGGNGAAGAKGGQVEVVSFHNVLTKGHQSYGIAAQSLGGGGGNGGIAVALAGSGNGIAGSIAVGGRGAGGGDGDIVTLTSVGKVITEGAEAIAVLAQSVGGGGGNGAIAVGAAGSLSTAAGTIGVGGTGGGGGNGLAVTVTSTGDIVTKGTGAGGIVAQSLGGGGGNGGWSGTGAVSFSNGALGIGVGGKGAGGGDGGIVEVTSVGNIATGAPLQRLLNGQPVLDAQGQPIFDPQTRAGGTGAHGILAQSVGGGGGNGGAAGGLSIGPEVAFAVTVGASGAGGGDAERVTVKSSGSITTVFDQSNAIAAQSIGGGGGNGGSTLALGLSANTGSGVVSVGGSGDKGGVGRVVEVTAAGALGTKGNGSNGILAQSLGGGGGNGGFSASGAISLGQGGFALGVGGKGKAGGGSDSVTVSAYALGTAASPDKSLPAAGTITLHTAGADANGILAQSIGGGGGNGGMAVALATADEVGALAIAVGGSADVGGAAGTVTVTSYHNIQTLGDRSSGIVAQSLGGGGGNGGGSVGVALGNETKLSAGVAVGGGGKGGGEGKTVTVTSAGQILTGGESAHGILAQSIGGGGGNGGFAIGAGLTMGQAGGSVSVGGNAAMGGKGGTVVVGAFAAVDAAGIGLRQLPAGTAATIHTTGRGAVGILAQSVGGGGGNGGFTVGAGLADEGASATVTVGGKGGGGGIGGTVQVTAFHNIATGGEKAYGILAQSIGGGGGNGGFSIALSAGEKFAAAAAVGGKGGIGQFGGSVTVISGGLISTGGTQAHGIFAQSVGGGGGNGGFSLSGASSAGNAGIGISVGGDGGIGNWGGAVTVERNLGLTLPANLATIHTTGGSAHGILAQSVGGGGGNGGFSGSFVYTVESDATIGFSLAGSGDNGGLAGTVRVTANDNILTGGAGAYGILAQSVGGGGGDGGFSFAATVSAPEDRALNMAVSLGGNGGRGGNGGLVIVTATGLVKTEGSHASGVVAQSIGGGGGNGGLSVGATYNRCGDDDCANDFPSIAASIGGKGAAGGIGQRVELTRQGNTITLGDYAAALVAQSIGGGGGNGGLSIAGGLSGKGGRQVTAAVGGAGGEGSQGGEVEVHNTGNIVTGSREEVQVQVAELGTVYETGIVSQGREAHGIFAQSIGGGGGNGGLAIAGGLTLLSEEQNPWNVGIAVGGSGGGGGFAKSVKVYNDGVIATLGDNAKGILAQSIGGGGGNGGGAITGLLTWGTGAPPDEPGQPSPSGAINVSVAVGGGGGDGNLSGAVLVDHKGAIETWGIGSDGIYAQSIGGGGGTGGNSNSISLQLSKECTFGLFGLVTKIISSCKGVKNGNKNIQVTVGGGGGEANDGNVVTVVSHGNITTHGLQARGIVAQSIGGGGGEGGYGIVGPRGLYPAVPGPVDPSLALAFISTTPMKGGLGTFSIGGFGGGGGDGKLVDVTNEGRLVTLGDEGIGIFAQSIGGGGGSGGDASSGIKGPLSIGGYGETAGNGGKVEVRNKASGVIDTTGLLAHGIFAQSIGGGGGSGGTAGGAIAIGGGGDAAGYGNEVLVENDGQIVTRGDLAHGIFAQSVGGGGGHGGNAKLTVVTVGGNAGASGDGMLVHVINRGLIETQGAQSAAILAQSIGGGGGAVSGQEGGDALGLIAVGGEGARAGNGGTVLVENFARIQTFGRAAIGIQAQSIGGGGGSVGGEMGLITAERDRRRIKIGGGNGSNGNGGDVTVTNNGRIQIVGDRSVAIFAQSIGGGGGYALAAAGADPKFAGGGAVGNGGAVKVINNGTIVIDGDDSIGILAQSIGGGGGTVAGGITTDPDDIGAIGNGGTVTIENKGSIYINGDNSIALLAQSIGGSGGLVTAGGTQPSTLSAFSTLALDEPAPGSIDFAGAIAGGTGIAHETTVDQTGDLVAHGRNSVAFWAQSDAPDGAGNIIANILNAAPDDVSLISGGSGSGAGFVMLRGADNQLNNYGIVTSDPGVEGFAGRSTTGNDQINNFGWMIGSLDLGSGANGFDNKAEARFDSGALLALGAGNLLRNDGLLSPGAFHRVLSSELTGNFRQGSRGVLGVDLDLDGFVSDQILASGSAEAEGTVLLNLQNVAQALPGTHDVLLVRADEGVTERALGIAAFSSAVATYSITYPLPTEIHLNVVIDYAAAGLTRNQTAVGEAVNAIQGAGGTEAFDAIAAALYYQPDAGALGATYDSLSGEGVAGALQAAMGGNDGFAEVVLRQADYWRLRGQEGQQAALTLDQLADLSTAQPGSRDVAEGARTGRDRRGDFRTWVAPFGSVYAQSGEDAQGSADLTYNAVGVAAGFETDATPDLLLGLAFGTSWSSYGVADRATSGSLRNVNVAGYALGQAGRFYATGLLGFNFAWGQEVRHAQVPQVPGPDPQIPGIAEQLEGSFNTQSFTGRLEAGVRFDLGGFNLSPFAAVEADYTTLDGFSEQQANGGGAQLGLAFADHSLLSLPLSAGVQLDGAWDFVEESRLAAWFRVQYVRELSTDRDIEASFLAAPDFGFEVKGADAPRNAVKLSGGLDLTVGSGVSLFIGGTGELRSEGYSAGGTAGVRIAW